IVPNGTASFAASSVSWGSFAAKDVTVGTGAMFFPIEPLVTNTPPRIISTPIRSVLQDDTFTYQMVVDDDPFDTHTFYVQTDPNTPVTLAQSGVLTWTVHQANVGVHQITVGVSDGGGLLDTQSFHLEVKDKPDSPVFTSAPQTSMPYNTTFYYVPTTTD